MYQNLRTVVDFIMALLLLLLLSPIVLLTAVAIKYDSKGPVFFLQSRIGKNGKEFKIIKFRSMYTSAQSDVLASGIADTRITNVGRFIRRCHLDEISQLFNVLLGNMGLIGPRPEIVKYVDMNSVKWQRALSIKPGITGLAAVKCAKTEYRILSEYKGDSDELYRSRILPRKLNYDIIYAQKQGVFLDLYILYLTARHFLV